MSARPTGPVSLMAMSLGADSDTELDETAEVEPVFAITPAALAKVLEIRGAEDDPESLCLWVEVTGVRGVDFTYDLSFETIADLQADDFRESISELLVAIPASSVDQLRGATLDLPAQADQGGLVLRNPNRPNPLAGLDLELTGELPDKVQQLLDQSINPSLDAHGGWASLVGVEGTKVFLTMGGGCQGCSLSAATLVQGIQVAIKEALPEVTDVVDVTDHTAGDNPFYS
jgi:Fe/S biogenesis protein NfuA